jgi:hypothetical protein
MVFCILVLNIHWGKEQVGDELCFFEWEEGGQYSYFTAFSMSLCGSEVKFLLAPLWLPKLIALAMSACHVIKALCLGNVCLPCHQGFVWASGTLWSESPSFVARLDDARIIS